MKTATILTIAAAGLLAVGTAVWAGPGNRYDDHRNYGYGCCGAAAYTQRVENDNAPANWRGCRHWFGRWNPWHHCDYYRGGYGCW